MNTFLPFPDFADSARVLDRQRLGKQRVEVLQLLRALSGEKQGWANHPCTRMWRGHEASLAAYGMAMCSEWVNTRGYKDTCYEKIGDLYVRHFSNSHTELPDWLGDYDFHAAHRMVLLAKDPEWYGQFEWSEQPAVPDERGSFKETYLWPA